MLTTTDYIGIGVLITTLGSSIVQIINATRLKGIETKVDGNTTAQTTLIAHLQNKLTDKDTQIADARQTAAVLASHVPAKLDEIASNTAETVQELKK